MNQKRNDQMKRVIHGTADMKSSEAMMIDLLDFISAVVYFTRYDYSFT